MISSPRNESGSPKRKTWETPITKKRRPRRTGNPMTGWPNWIHRRDLLPGLSRFTGRHSPKRANRRKRTNRIKPGRTRPSPASHPEKMNRSRTIQNPMTEPSRRSPPVTNPIQSPPEVIPPLTRRNRSRNHPVKSLKSRNRGTEITQNLNVSSSRSRVMGKRWNEPPLRRYKKAS